MLTGKKRSIWQRFWTDRWLLLLLLPTVVLLVLFNYLPLYGLSIAFQNYKIGNPLLSFDGSIEWVGLKHFKDFIESVFFKRVFSNTIRLSFKTILFGFWVPVLFAVLLNEVKVKWYKKTTQTFVYLPYFVSTVIVVAMMISMTSGEGVINKMVRALGGSTVYFMQDPKYFDGLYIFTQIWQTFGYSSIIYLAGIASINPSLYEAAVVDGANRLHKIWYITLPGILPMVVILLILSIGGLIAANTEKVLLMYSPPLYDRADVIGTYVYRIGLINAKYSYTTAVGLFSNIIAFALVFTTNQIARKYTEYSLW